MTATTRTVRVISVEVANARDWKHEIRRLNYRRPGLDPSYLTGTTIERYRQAAATAELLGVPVGIVVGVREEEVGRADPQ